MRRDVQCALLALLAGALVAGAAAARETMSVPQWALDSTEFGAPHARAEYELPDGVKRDTPAADRYWNRWLACSSLVAWCTPEEVACGCTYEPDDTSGDGAAWYAGRFDWNAGKDRKVWPYCQPGLAELYAKCKSSDKRLSSCRVPKEMRVFNGNGAMCVNHAMCGDYPCKDKVQATRAPFI